MGKRPTARRREPFRAGTVADAIPDNWVDRWAPEAARPYLRLARADRPIGVWLLLGGLLLSYANLIPAFGEFQVTSISKNSLPLIYLAIGQAVIVIAGGIDLSHRRRPRCPRPPSRWRRGRRWQRRRSHAGRASRERASRAERDPISTWRGRPWRGARGI